MANKSLDVNQNYPTFQHPPFKEAEMKSQTDVKYEAPKPPTNQYDVELYKLQLEQWRENAPLRWIGAITSVGGLAFGLFMLFKVMFGKDEK